MRADNQRQVQVPGFQFVIARFALPGQAQFIAGQHAGRDGDLQADFGQFPAAALASGADAFLEQSPAIAGIALDQPAVSVVHAAAAVAGIAEVRPRHAGFAAAFAGRAGLAAGDVDGLAATGCRFFEADVEVEADVGGAGHAVLGLGLRRFAFGIFRFWLIFAFDRSNQLVGGVDDLETLGRLRVVVAVRVPAHGEAPVGPLPVGRAGIASDAEDG